MGQNEDVAKSTRLLFFYGTHCYR